MQGIEFGCEYNSHEFCGYTKKELLEWLQEFMANKSINFNDGEIELTYSDEPYYNDYINGKSGSKQKINAVLKEYDKEIKLFNVSWEQAVIIFICSDLKNGEITLFDSFDELFKFMDAFNDDEIKHYQEHEYEMEFYE